MIHEHIQKILAHDTIEADEVDFLLKNIDLLSETDKARLGLVPVREGVPTPAPVPADETPVPDSEAPVEETDEAPEPKKKTTRKVTK